MLSISHNPAFLLRTAGVFLVLTLLTALSADAKPRDADRWNSNYKTDVYLFGKRPIRFLEENVQRLPKGKVLDIAMGEGRNGVFLATLGFDVLGVDISSEGLNKAHKLAEELNTKIETRVVDLETYSLPEEEYDVILCTYYLQRDLFPQIRKALRHGGMAVIETYNTEHLKYAGFPRKYLLEPDELLEIFKGFDIIKHENFDDGKEAHSSIIVQKP